MAENREIKVKLAPVRHLYKADEQDIETLEQMKNEPQYWLFVPADDDNDHMVPGADGKVTRVRTININGIQWFIPVAMRTQVPQSIYEVYMQSLERASRPPRVRPNQMVKLDIFGV